MTRQRGFTVLEALLAVAILALALFPLLELQRQQIRATARQQVAWERISAERNALALVTEINPTVRDRGETRLADGAVVRWEATPLGEPVRNAGFPAGDGLFDVTLYRVDVTVTDADGSTILADFAVERMGWRRIVDAAEERRASVGIP